jgi:hypothetical protein
MIRTTEEFPTEYRQRNIRIFSEGWNDTVKKKREENNIYHSGGQNKRPAVASDHIPTCSS